jgi:hypothetical protein
MTEEAMMKTEEEMARLRETRLAGADIGGEAVKRGGAPPSI